MGCSPRIFQLESEGSDLDGKRHGKFGNRMEEEEGGRTTTVGLSLKGASTLFNLSPASMVVFGSTGVIDLIQPSGWYFGI